MKAAIPREGWVGITAGHWHPRDTESRTYSGWDPYAMATGSSRSGWCSQTAPTAPAQGAVRWVDSVVLDRIRLAIHFLGPARQAISPFLGALVIQAARSISSACIDRAISFAFA